jgi:exonuclease III
LAVTKTNADVIFLSDIRLNSLIQIAAVNDIEKKIKFNGYEFLYNSPFASREVGILIKKDLGFSISETKKDREGNILLLKCNKNGTEGNHVTLGSIYGPNDNNREFFADLKKMLKDLGGANIILGGDWNATWDSSAVGILTLTRSLCEQFQAS